MEARHVRLGLWSTSIICCLLFVLYLPVAIWSPPWSPFGYYQIEYFDPIKETNKIGYLKFSSNSIAIFNIENDDNIDHFIINIIYNPNLNQWETSDRKEKAIIKYHDSAIYILHEEQKINEVDKTSRLINPITLWHIKWLEWTAE